MKIIWRRVRWSVLGIVLAFLALNFIPIKWAVRMPLHVEDSYVCSYTTATDGNWYASIEDNPHLHKALYINVNVPETSNFLMLKEIADCRKGIPINNKYVFYGEIEQREAAEDTFFNQLQPSNWDIVYPVRRDSIRNFIAPRSYLTVYDYDWGKVFILLIGSK